VMSQCLIKVFFYSLLVEQDARAKAFPHDTGIG
jgi:hypothetical protein